MKKLIRCAAQVVASLATTYAIAQLPFQLDPTFNTPQLAHAEVASALPLNDGTTLIADDSSSGFSFVSKLLPSGARDPSFTGLSPGVRHLQAWQNLFYVATSLSTYRLYGDGSPDYTYAYNIPDYFPAGMGGYYLYPDGGVVIAGLSLLTDTVHGFVGNDFVLTWLTPDGHLDTTRTHRRGNNQLESITRVNDGGFFLSGALITQYEGHPVGHIFKVDSLGALDTTFNTTANYGLAASMMPLPDGRVLAGGVFLFGNDPDTMQVVRLMPDGSLDPTFNNHIPLLYYNPPFSFAAVEQIFPLGPDSLIIVGGFNYVDGIAHNGIALIDSTGQLRSEIFPPGSGVMGYDDIDGHHQGVIGIVRDANGGYLIHGIYHGYSDGVNTDPGQWDVTRLNGLNVGVQEHTKPKEGVIQIYPNPASETIALGWDVWLHPSMFMVCDVTGREVMRGALVQGAHQTTVDVRALVSGTYCVRLFSGAQPLAVQRMVIGP